MSDISRERAAGGSGGGLTEAEVETIIARAEKIGTTQLAALAVTAAKIAAGAVTAAKLGAEAVEETAIKVGAVGTATIAAKAVTAAKLAENAVETSIIKNEAVTEAKLSATATGWLNATKVTGVDSTGATDSTEGMILAIKEAYEKGVGLWVPPGKYKIGENAAGKHEYGIDLSRIAAFKGKIVKLEIFCSAEAEFIGHKELTGEGKPVWRLKPPAAEEANQLWRCWIKLGKVTTANTTHASDLVEVQTLSDSYLEIHELSGFARFGLLMDQRSGEFAKKVLGNNEIHVHYVGTNPTEAKSAPEVGINLIGSSEANARDCAGNYLVIGHITSCIKHGLVNGYLNRKLETVEEEKQLCEANTFQVGSIEVCGEYGAIDACCRGSRWNMTSDANEKGGFAIAGPTKFIPEFFGELTDTTPVSLNNKPADLFNMGTNEPGWVALEGVNAEIEAGGLGEGGKQFACCIIRGMVFLTGQGKTKKELVAGAEIFKLPAGFRPTKTRHVAAAYSGAGFSLEIAPTGKVKITEKAVISSFIGVDGVSFPLKVVGE